MLGFRHLQISYSLLKRAENLAKFSLFSIEKHQMPIRKLNFSQNLNFKRLYLSRSQQSDQQSQKRKNVGFFFQIFGNIFCSGTFPFWSIFKFQNIFFFSNIPLCVQHLKMVHFIKKICFAKLKFSLTIFQIVSHYHLFSKNHNSGTKFYTILNSSANDAFVSPLKI